MSEEGGGIRARFAGADVKDDEQVYETVLVAVGRRPNSEIPGLDHTQVKLDGRGFVVVDAQRRTAIRISMPSAMSPASRCWHTRRRMKGVSPPK